MYDHKHAKIEGRHALEPMLIENARLFVLFIIEHDDVSESEL